jgi:hypothetical protein
LLNRFREAVLKICASPHVSPPSLLFFVTPSEARGPSALARLGRTSRDAVPNEVRGDAVPNVVRDASLSLGKTIKRTLGGTKYGVFLNSLIGSGRTKKKKEDMWELVKGGNLGYSLAKS